MATSVGSDGIVMSGGSGGMVESINVETGSGSLGTSKRKSQAESYVSNPLQKHPGKKYCVEGSQQYGYAWVQEE